MRSDLFNETATRMGLNAVVVEKDFWVCWLLKQLFTIKEFDGWLVFKGGTSLLKCFNLIQRFSEDIDLAVDFEKLGFTGTKDPRRANLSHTRRRTLLDEMLVECQHYIAGSFLGILTNRVREVLGQARWVLKVSDADPNTVEFEYPSALGRRLKYVNPRVVLELGTHAEPIPHEAYPLQPFAAEYFPYVFNEPTCSVTTVVARRTFWEKATILHAEYHRPLDKPLLQRCYRHYADVAMMAQATVKREALADLKLLHNVTIHKDRFYHCAWARYLDAKPGSFHLLPRDERLPELRRDYQAMQVMFFKDPLDFETVLQRLMHLERDINSSA
jgi:hypothetical protein